MTDQVEETNVAETTDTSTEVGTTAVASEPVNGYWWGTGRRKTSIARVRARPGSGKMLINGRETDKYFTEDRDRQAIRAPLSAAQYEGRLDDDVFRCAAEVEVQHANAHKTDNHERRIIAGATDLAVKRQDTLLANDLG